MHRKVRAELAEVYAERPKLHMRMRRTKLLGYNAATDASEALRVNLQREGTASGGRGLAGASAS